MSEQIPTYAEANALQPPPLATSLPLPPALPEPEDEPPAYAVLDSTQTTFMIYGTFIHTPAGPCYQLSSPLDQRGPYFRIRRLAAKDVSLLAAGNTPLSFDRSATLYEVNDPPLLDNEYHMQGKRRSCLPGVLEMKYRTSRGRWEVRQVAKVGSGAKGVEVLSSKRVGGRFGNTKLDRKREMEVSEWKDARGGVVATEVLKMGGHASKDVVPTLELSGELDQTWREVVLSLWAARLWVAFGVEKTAKLGGRYGDTRLAKHGPLAMTGVGLMGAVRSGPSAG